MIVVVTGDLVKLTFSARWDVIVHGCNCFCTMGAGIAKQIKETFPIAYKADCSTTTGDRKKLGSYTSASIKYPNPPNPPHDLTIVNAYTQYKYGTGMHVDYEAIGCVFHSLAEDFKGKRIVYPKIGADCDAGGDWDIISKIINKELHGFDHTLVIY